MARMITYVALLCLAAACGAAAGPSLQQRFQATVGDVVSNTGNLMSWAASEEEWHRGGIAIKYFVLPGREEKFLHAWMKMKNETAEKDKGLHVFSLSKVATDNTIFYSWAVWESKGDFMSHIKSDHVKEYMRDIAELDVAADMTATARITQHSGERKEDAVCNTHHTPKPWGRGVFNMVVRYYVPPSQFMDWEKTVKEVARMVGDKESGNNRYEVHKTMIDNYEAILYGEWESMDDYIKHLESDHLRHLLTFNQEHGIMWNMDPLITLAVECPSKKQD